jgi:peptidoglycan/xylan/chitin deacetylase (PgdA/CDA1 family)
LADFLLILEQKKQPPSKPVLLTFDDGYSDNYEFAMPILQRHQFPATIFISPGSIGQTGYLDWKQVKEMHLADWDIQPHGMTHPHLPQLSTKEQQQEIMNAREQIEAQLGTIADIFCYPYGEYNEKTLEVLRNGGFRYAFTIMQGRTEASQPPLQLKRLFVNGEESLRTWMKKL